MSDSSTPLLDFLRDHLSGGKRVSVQFNKHIEEQDGYADEGLRAEITGFTGPDHDGVVIVAVDYSAFEAFNAENEKANYYDQDKKPVLTARQANRYQPQENFYLMANDDPEDFFQVLDRDLTLLREWKDSGAEASYTRFLEEQLLALRAQLEPTEQAPVAKSRGPRP